MIIQHLFSSSLLGIDVQSNAVRLVHLKKKWNEFTIEQAVYRELAAGVVVDGKIRQWNLFTELITEIVQANGVSGMTACICLPANLVRMHRMQLPYFMPDELIEAEIRDRIERDFPSIKETLYVDFQVLDHEDDAGMDIFFVASRKEYIQQYVQCIHAAGLRVKIVDINACALTRPFYHCPEFSIQRGMFYAVVYLSGKTVHLIIFSTEEIVQQQQWEMSNEKDFLAQLATRMQIFAASFRQITICKLAIYGFKRLCPGMSEASVSFPTAICFPDPFAWMNWSERAQAYMEAENDNMPDFLAACGAAMREVPKW